MHLLRLMLVGVWLGLLWVLFYFFDHYIQSSVLLSSVSILSKFSSVKRGLAIQWNVKRGLTPASFKRE